MNDYPHYFQCMSPGLMRVKRRGFSVCVRTADPVAGGSPLLRRGKLDFSPAEQLHLKEGFYS